MPGTTHRRLAPASCLVVAAAALAAVAHGQVGPLPRHVYSGGSEGGPVFAAADPPLDLRHSGLGGFRYMFRRGDHKLRSLWVGFVDWSPTRAALNAEFVANERHPYTWTTVRQQLPQQPWYLPTLVVQGSVPKGAGMSVVPIGQNGGQPVITSFSVDSLAGGHKVEDLGVEIFLDRGQWVLRTIFRDRRSSFPYRYRVTYTRVLSEVRTGVSSTRTDSFRGAMTLAQTGRIALQGFRLTFADRPRELSMVGVVANHVGDRIDTFFGDDTGDDSYFAMVRWVQLIE